MSDSFAIGTLKFQQTDYVASIVDSSHIAFNYVQEMHRSKLPMLVVQSDESKNAATEILMMPPPYNSVVEYIPLQGYVPPDAYVAAEARSNNAESNSAKPPAAHWEQSDCLGKEAATPQGQDIERLALSVLGKKIDDGLGRDGCMESISNHILKPHFESIGEKIPRFQDSHLFIPWAKKHQSLFSVIVIPQHDLRPENLQPGDVIIGNKSTGNHCLVVARIPKSWGGSANCLALLGNTGHPEYCPDGPNGPHFRVLEFIGTPDDEAKFGTHHGGPESYSPDNPYNIPGATWTVIRLKR